MGNKVKMPSGYSSGLVKRNEKEVKDFIDNQSYYATNMRMFSLRVSDTDAVRYFRNLDKEWEKLKEMFNFLLDFYKENTGD